MQDDLELHPELTADEVENWTSLRAIEIMVAVEMHFGIKFSSRHLGKLKSVGKFVDIIKAAKGSVL
jgi:acyl carrier protein